MADVDAYVDVEVDSETQRSSIPWTTEIARSDSEEDFMSQQKHSEKKISSHVYAAKTIGRMESLQELQQIFENMEENGEGGENESAEGIRCTRSR